MLHHGSVTNDFIDDDRLYPIDFEYPLSKVISINYEIPDGYNVKSLPEDKEMTIRDNIASLSFLTKVIDNKINVSCSLQVNHSIVSKEYYKEIKEIFSELVNASKSLIVLSKK